MPRLSSLISKGLNTPYVEPGYWHIPTGAVIMYGGTSDPGLVGWSRYSAADGRFIKGTATQAEIGVTSAGNTSSLNGYQQSASTGTGGAHYGSSALVANTYFNGTSGRAIYGISGAHAHTLTYRLSSGTDINPNSSDLVLLVATQEQKYFPPNTWQIMGTQPTGTTQITATTDVRYIRGAATKIDTSATQRDFSGTTDSLGTHQHDTSAANNAGPQVSPTGTGSWYFNTVYLPGGPTGGVGTSHSHVVTAALATSRITGKLLKLWTRATRAVPDNSTIIMYTGNISDLRDYWKVCDGTNGTPNMVDYFLGYSNISSTANDTATAFAMSVVGGGTMSTGPWIHGHLSNSYTQICWPQTIYHTEGDQGHTHTFIPPSTTTFQPAEIKVCFIQLQKTA